MTRGSFGLDHLVDPGPPRTVTLTVTREGFEPAVHGLAVPGTPASPAPAATVRTPHLVAESADVALRRLVGALASTRCPLPSRRTMTANADNPLAAHVWEAAITEDLERLAAWERHHRHPLRQWRSTATTLANLDPLWAAHRSSERGRIVLPLLTAGLLAALDGAIATWRRGGATMLASWPPTSASASLRSLWPMSRSAGTSTSRGSARSISIEPFGRVPLTVTPPS
ncbi:MAG: hypothetical protein V9G12_19610 [Microthrixaceae bacterium]